MNKKIIIIGAAIGIAAAMLSACSSQEEPRQLTVEEKQKFFNTLEDARSAARENALFNANVYRSESPRLDGTKVVSHGDSTQSADCPQGDGWATVSFMNVSGAGQGKEVEKYVAKCSTVSAALGCYLEADFQKKPFAKEENRCNPTLPFPLPKIAK